jgi:hypothetical protein
MASAAATPPGRRLPSRAVLALLLALCAFGVSLYGALVSERHLAGSPLNVARSAAGAEFTHASENARIALALVAYGLPLVLGVAAGVLGTRTMRALSDRPEDRVQHFVAVLAVMVGGLAAVVSACMLIGVYGWPHVPHWYTA